MSDYHSPEGAPEYLEHGGGLPLAPSPEQADPAAPHGRRSRRAWWIGGGVVALLGLGAGAWAALSFFQQGEQPAHALPASTVAYLSIDLDPAGGQKIDAFRTLNKFPAFKDQVGVSSVDDLRHKLGREIVSSEHCQSLDYDRDIDPWLGNRAAIALVDLPDAKPDAVVVVQVTDDDKARAGLALLDSCATDRTGHATGYVVKDGWAVLADSQGYADRVVAATAQGTLADDPTYQKWTKELGEAGVVNAYASPEAGRLLASKLGPFMGGEFSPFMFTTPDPYAVPGATASYSASSMAFHGARGAAGGDGPVGGLSDFKGGAATLRFTGDGVEFAMAADGSSGSMAQFSGNTAGTLIQRLPGDTAAAAGITFPPGWVARQLEQLSSIFSPSSTPEEQRRQLSRETGLDIPDDIDTLLGSGVALSISKDFSVEDAQNSADGSGLPIALTVKGDPAAIDRVLGKLRARLGSAPYLGSDSQGDLEVIGPSPDYRQRVLAGGSLGGDDTFRSVVPDAGAAASVFYLNMDALEPSLAKALSSQEMGNLTPLRALGMSSWKDGDTVRFSFKASTD